MRSGERIAVDESARLHPNGWSSVEVRLLDISVGGFRAECEARVRPGDVVAIELPSAEPARAWVSWCRGKTFGARFVEPFPLERAAVKPAGEADRLARLLVERAAAHRGNRRDHEEELRRRIRSALPIQRL